MIVYRALKEREIGNLMKGINEIDDSAPKGKNTHHYDKGVDYTHFFYFFDSAIQFLNVSNHERYYNKYVLIAAYDISETVLKNGFGYGKYNMTHDCTKDDGLLKFLQDKTLFYPEFAVPSKLISQDMLIGLGNARRLTPIDIKWRDTLYETVLHNQSEYLNYLRNMYELYDLYSTSSKTIRFWDTTNYEEILSILERNKEFFFEPEGITKMKKFR